MGENFRVNGQKFTRFEFSISHSILGVESVVEVVVNSVLFGAFEVDSIMVGAFGVVDSVVSIDLSLTIVVVLVANVDVTVGFSFSFSFSSVSSLWFPKSGSVSPTLARFFTKSQIKRNLACQLLQQIKFKRSCLLYNSYKAIISS